MRRGLACHVAAALVAAGAVSDAGAAQAPTLRIIDTAPLTVRGVHFRARENVRVTAIVTGLFTLGNDPSGAGLSRQRRTHTATAGATGSFTLRLRGLERPMCGSYRVVAVGDRGSRATRSLPLPPCAQP